MNKTEWHWEIRRSSDGSLKDVDTVVDTEGMAFIEARAQLLADQWEDDEYNEIAVFNEQTGKCHYHFCLVPEEPEEIKTYRFEHKTKPRVTLAFGATVEEAFEQVVDLLEDKDLQNWEATTNDQ